MLTKTTTTEQSKIFKDYCELRLGQEKSLKELKTKQQQIKNQSRKIIKRIPNVSTQLLDKYIYIYKNYESEHIFESLCNSFQTASRDNYINNKQAIINYIDIFKNLEKEMKKFREDKKRIYENFKSSYNIDFTLFNCEYNQIKNIINACVCENYNEYDYIDLLNDFREEVSDISMEIINREVVETKEKNISRYYDWNELLGIDASEESRREEQCEYGIIASDEEIQKYSEFYDNNKNDINSIIEGIVEFANKANDVDIKISDMLEKNVKISKLNKIDLESIDIIVNDIESDHYEIPEDFTGFIAENIISECIEERTSLIKYATLKVARIVNIEKYRDELKDKFERKAKRLKAENLLDTKLFMLNYILNKYSENDLYKNTFIYLSVNGEN